MWKLIIRPKLLSNKLSISFFSTFDSNIFTDRKFSDLDYLREDIKSFCRKLGYEHLTNIQKEAIDSIFNHQHNLVLGETGSGKTLLYLLPIVNDMYNFYQKLEEMSEEEKIEAKSKPRGALIFTLNKELAAQAYVDLKKLDKLNKLKVTRLGSLSQMSTYVKHMVK